MTRTHIVSTIAAFLAGIATVLVLNQGANAQDGGGAATCIALPLVGPSGMEKAAVKGAEAIDQLRAAGKSNIEFGAGYVCGW